MNAFISYSHLDNQMLDRLHKHLAQLQRDGIITAWTDQEILAGGKLNQNISSSLSNSKLFIALLSPDYLASNYCYEKEFEKALEMEKQRKLIIVPVILEPCDWLNTPFKEFKALPKDGKAVSTWENKNTAFLDIIQNLRRLIESEGESKTEQIGLKSSQKSTSRNYRVQKDFDSIEKMEFVEKSLHDVKEFLKRYLDEILQIDNIKTRVLIDNNKEFQYLLVNRNKIATEAQLHISIDSENNSSIFSLPSQQKINYTIIQNNRPSNKTFSLAFDDYHLFWTENNYFSGGTRKELGAKEIADVIWNEWLESVGII
ncbi:MAG TPA: toll/interleukin-1 receptor domain-containing protein [Chitinophagaceae bacterium]